VKTIVNSRRLLLASALFAQGAAWLHSQTVIGSSPAIYTPLQPSVSPAATGTAASPGVVLSNVSSALSQPKPVAYAGPFGVRPHFTYEVVRGTGILRLPGRPQKVTMQTISPGVTLEAGTRGTIDYTLSRVMYSSRQLEDATNHNLRLQANHTQQDWNLALNGAYGLNSTILVETGGQTEEESYSTRGMIARRLGSSTELEVNLGQSVRSADPVDSNTTWNSTDWTLWSAATWQRYHVSKGLSAAAGFAVGYDEIDQRPDMSHYQPQVQVRWRPTAKLSLNAEAGVERRRVRATLGRTESNGRYSAGVTYSPVSTTTLTLGANRSVEPSYFVGQTSQSEGWNVGIQQRLLGRLFLSAGASQRRMDYESEVINRASPRDDRYESYDVRLSAPVLQRGSVSVFYQRGRNRSSEALYAFTSDQVGGQLSYRF
jgi:hypothetical protein